MPSILARTSALRRTEISYTGGGAEVFHAFPGARICAVRTLGRSSGQAQGTCLDGTPVVISIYSY